MTIVSLALALSACSGGAEPEASDTATPTPSQVASPSASPVVAPTGGPEVEPPSPPRTRKGPTGHKAFARFVMDAWAWSLRHNDAGPLLAVSPSKRSPCNGCEPLVRELAERDDEGWYVDFPGVSVDRIQLRQDGDVVVATSRVDIPASDAYQYDGSYRSSNSAHEDATFVVRMQLVKGAYRLVSFAVA